MSSAFLMLCAALVGMLLPVQAATNAGASKYLGDVSYAALLSFIIGAIVLSIYILITKPVFNSDVVNVTFPKYILLGGLISVVYTVAITYLSPILGIGNTLFTIITGQILAAFFIDHFGICNAITHEITPTRMLGLMLMAIGLFLALSKYEL